MNFFRHFRLPVTSETKSSARTRQFPIILTGQWNLYLESVVCLIKINEKSNKVDLSKSLLFSIAKEAVSQTITEKDEKNYNFRIMQYPYLTYLWSNFAFGSAEKLPPPPPIHHAWS